MSDVSRKNELLRLAEENRRLSAALVEAQKRIACERANVGALEAKLALVARTAGMWAWEAGIEADFIWDLNRPTELGMDEVPIEELGLRFFGMIEEEDRQQVLLDHQQALERRETKILHRYRVRLPDGTLRHYEGRGAFIYNEGAPTRAMGINVDVTDELKAAQLLKQQAAELSDAQRRLERASLSSQEGHWDFDLASKRMWVSSSYYQLLGYPDGSGLQTREQYLELVHPDDRERDIEIFDAHIDRNEPLDTELRIRTAEGAWRWMRVRGMAELDEQRRPVRISGSIQDIHQKKIAEDDLRVVRQRFERAIRGTHDGLWEWDLVRDVFWVSPRFEEILDYPGQVPSAGRDFRSFITHPDDEELVRAAYRAHFAGAAPLDVEMRLRHATRGYIWVRLRGHAEWDAHNKPIRVSGSIHDITEARAAREELVRATEAAHAANRAKSDFLANVSHEIRTPMNGVIGMSTLLLETQLDATQLDYVQTIRNSGDSLLTVINDILDFSKIEAGKLDIETLDVDLRRTAEDVCAVMAIQAASKDLDLVVDVQLDVPDTVRGDPQRIRQCLINLVGNAIKFTSKGEVVLQVSARQRENGASSIRFEVRDTGIGIDPTAAARLFQPFVQADSSTTRHFGGTGLGLSIVRRLVEMMGGNIGLDSRPGQGSTFWFDLPSSAAIAAPAAPSPRVAASGARVLVVDRNPTVCRVIATLLSAAGYAVTTSTDANEAAIHMREALVHDRHFAAALIDERSNAAATPGINEQIHANPLLSMTATIMLASLNSRYDQNELTEQGYAAALAKPVRRQELLSCVQRVLNKEQAPGTAESTRAATRAAQPDSSQRCFGKILLVEDNPVNQKVASRFLERLGYVVTIAGDGAQAVSAFEHGQFDAILMDLQMPVMDGYAATQAIRDRERGSRIPIIALTASAMTGQLERCLASNMDGLLTKPLLIDRLRETMEEHGVGRQVTERKSISLER